MTLSRAAQSAPKTTDAAIALLDAYKRGAGELATIEANRTAALAATNAVADRLAAPLLEQQAALLARLEPWWAKHVPALTKGKRKSVELGGCMIGSKTGRASLEHGYADDAAAVAALQAHRWARRYVRVSYAVDKTATRAALDGPHGMKLAELGFRETPGAETFYVERVAQAGVVTTSVAA